MLLSNFGHFIVGQLVVIFCLLCGDISAKTFVVHWNISNPIFRIDNTDNVFDVDVGNTPQEYDQANILCPYYSKEENETIFEEYMIYSVSREEYETCHISNPNPRIIANCRDPHRPLLFTITFRTFTPTPGGLEFQPGKDYYFISTSAPGDLHRRTEGRCSTHNMKVIFKVKEKRQEALTSTPESTHRHKRPPTPTNFDDGSKLTFVTQEDKIIGSSQSPSPKLDPSFYDPIRPAETPMNKQRNSENEVLSNSRRKSRNEERGFKQEASRMAANAAGATSATGRAILTTFVVLFSLLKYRSTFSV